MILEILQCERHMLTVSISVDLWSRYASIGDVWSHACGDVDLHQSRHIVNLPMHTQAVSDMHPLSETRVTAAQMFEYLNGLPPPMRSEQLPLVFEAKDN